MVGVLTLKRVWNRHGSVGTCYVNMKAEVTMTLPEAKENPGFQKTAERTGKKRAEGVLRLKVEGILKHAPNNGEALHNQRQSAVT